MNHQWVKIVITPVHIVADPEVSSEPVIFIREDDQQEAEECAQYGCNRCDETLTSETVNTECDGGEEDLEDLLRNTEDRP
jgi:hypothetical protein